MDVEGRFSPYQQLGQAQVCEPDRQFITKIVMAMGCSGVGGQEVGVKCGCMQGCCEGVRLDVRSCRPSQVAVCMKTNRVGAAKPILGFATARA